jgi:hypothetical protein
VCDISGIIFRGDAAFLAPSCQKQTHPFAEMLGDGLLIDVRRRSGSLMA